MNIKEFHISRKARDRYQFDQSLFTLNGNVVFANFHAARVFAQKMNQQRDLLSYPEQAVKAGLINGMGLIDEILHLVIQLYQEQKSANAMIKALTWVEERLGSEIVTHTLLQFVQEFPPLAVYQKELSPEEYLQEDTNGVPNRAIALEEMLMLWISNKNPAYQPFAELFDDQQLSSRSQYLQVIRQVYLFFETQPPFGPDQQNLVDMLRSPAIVVPYSIFGQLEYIRTRWAGLLGKYLYRLLSSLDLIKEEEKISFPGGGIVPIPIYQLAQGEYERFSPDKEWMPRLVLIAKNAYVWLDQLSKKYHYPIQHLDQIPDEELARLSSWGFNGLWLIGIWERSQASARIKQLCGNPEAIASAYSLADYRIASDLGGEGAFQNLQRRAWQHGIRLASDMVPNHMAIDSQWVIEHPDWFISLDHAPFPSYSFNGQNLSSDPRVSIFIEDHYYDRTDAAVVFKRHDNYTGKTEYIYHGNDGTSTPWNDTAQLNYLNPNVREAVIQTILHVARQFPIIRFDAAMTLTKRHYQRLWFPEPGTGGDIPSRAGHGLTRAQFDALMPNEFWREVVDRVAQEVPDTLLLAEAFWLMEGYFVRTLGMHRVYNSAFMNMLRNEDNAKYRLVMKNTLEFDPEILKRFVNFMNNPDERTAVDQFGKGDKYFGICTLMVTMPGLPMFGHGQIEGFAEKYGMEFRKAYWDETPDTALVERHQREIFPLLHRRQMFAGVELFLLYDFYCPEGYVNEDVFAFSNGFKDQRALVVYHNKYASTRGWIKTSVGFVDKGKTGSEAKITQRSLHEGLNIFDRDSYVIFRDTVTQLEYLYPCQEIIEHGLYVELGAYEYHVWLDFVQVKDDQHQTYHRLWQYLNGRGVPSIQDAITLLMLQTVQNPFYQIANSGYFKYLLSIKLHEADQRLPDQLASELDYKLRSLTQGIKELTGDVINSEEFLAQTTAKLSLMLQLPVIQSIYSLPNTPPCSEGLRFLQSRLSSEDHKNWLTALGWCFTHCLGFLKQSTGYEDLSLSWFEEWQLGRIINELYQTMGFDTKTADWMVNTIKILISQQNWLHNKAPYQALRRVETWLSKPEIQTFLSVNRYQDVLWFNKEAFDELLWWMMLIAVVNSLQGKDYSAELLAETIVEAYTIISALQQSANLSDYQVAKLIEIAKEKLPDR
ncbi:MAG: alpha-amylase [Anaerolineae bacterium]|nr:alpha-amylase [Anaerolineae bacterium]